MHNIPVTAPSLLQKRSNSVGWWLHILNTRGDPNAVITTTLKDASQVVLKSTTPEKL